MTDKKQGWGWFDEQQAPIGGDEALAAELPGVFARCFRGDDGERVLGYLTALTLGRSLGPAVSDAALRHVEGQRQLVSHVMSLVQRGRGDGVMVDPLKTILNKETEDE